MLLLDENDRIVVVELTIGADWATFRAKDASDLWLSTFVTPSENAAKQITTGFARRPLSLNLIR